MKNQRVLEIYSKLLKEEEVNLKKLAKKYGVSERSIQRDLSDIKNFCYENDVQGEVVYDRVKKSYILQRKEEFTNSEIIAISKILLDSRAFRKTEMQSLVKKLVSHCLPKSKAKDIRKLLRNEEAHYMELQHKNSFLQDLENYANYIQEHKKLRVSYQRVDGAVVERVICPVGMMFSDYYFYLLAHIDKIDKKEHFKHKDDVFPTIYRLDRIRACEELEEVFPIPYKDRFEEGEFRKRIHFMTGGPLRKLRFRYKGMSLEAVLDKIPTAKVIEKTEEGYILTAEVFGVGIDYWIRSQGKDVEILEYK